MATMFPSDVARFTTTGEETVYRFLQKAARPDKDFLVWYSPDIEDREPDFILLSPDSGLIVLEVKDWLANQLVEITPKDALLRIGKREERRKQPLAQAREYVNSLMHLLKNCAERSLLGHSLPCPVTWGAIFPHISRSDFNACHLNEVMDGNRILCWDEVNADSPLVRDASGQIFRKWLSSHFPPLFPFSLSRETLNWLRSRIFPVVRIDLPRRSGSTAQADTILALDQEQENLARTFGSEKTLISGPSGSGKTLILVHQAWHLPRVDKNIHRVLIVCFNLSLVGYIRRLLARKGVSLGPDGVEVIPFYSLCERILGEPLAHVETTDFYTLVVQETLSKLDGTHPLQKHWDAILVDEGQDFSKEMAKVILLLLPSHGTLTVALDKNQCLYADGTAWDEVNDLRKRQLHRQYRNTKQIAAMAQQMLGDNSNDTIFAGADGVDPQILNCNNEEELIQKVADGVKSLVSQGVSMGEIAVLYTRSKIEGIPILPEALLEAIEKNGVLARWVARNTTSKRSFDITTDSVTISTVYSVKGIDFSHVFLIALDDNSNKKYKQLQYVGITRAREFITLINCVG